MGDAVASQASIYDLFSVRGRRALVTGGSAGLGRPMAEALIAGGAKVAIAARSSRVFDAAQEMGAIPLQMDLADRDRPSPWWAMATENR